MRGLNIYFFMEFDFLYYHFVGLTGDPFTGCSDTDECSAHANPCGSGAVCRNTNPGFVCECPPGKIYKEIITSFLSYRFSSFFRIFLLHYFFSLQDLAVTVEPGARQLKFEHCAKLISTARIMLNASMASAHAALDLLRKVKY